MNVTSPLSVDYVSLFINKALMNILNIKSLTESCFPWGSFLETEFIVSHYRFPKCPLEKIVPVYTPLSWV